MKRIKRFATLLLALVMLLSLAAPAFAVQHTVVKGDNLSKIAKQYLGSASRWREIYNANKDKIKNPNLIYVGQTLTIPGEEPQPTETPTPQPTETPTPQPTEEPGPKPVVDTRLPATEGYIPAPYVTNEDHLTDEVLEPKFYANGKGEPTIGVTLLGVIVQDGKHFRDLNNNGKLDTFEDWRLPAEERAAAYTKALSDYQLTHQIVNEMAYSPKGTTVSAVVGEDGKPVWTKLFSATGGFSSSGNGSNLPYLSTGFRNFVVRNNPATEVAVWFNNGLEQYAELDAITKGEVNTPYFTFTNPIAHGMPGALGVTAAALGDGNANTVLTDSQYDRTVMWAKGIDGIYGPQIDLVTDPRWSRNDGTYGERVDMAEEIARNLTIGYQNGDKGMVSGSVLLTVKHFPGDGAAYNGFESHGEAGRYRIYSTENSLANYQLKPFIAAFEAGAAGVMPGYSQPIVDKRIAPQSITYEGKTVDIRFGGYGNAFNSDILLTLLRDTLGFKGLINSDSLNPGQYHGVEDLSDYDKLVLYIKSGVDCGCISVGKGEIFMEALNNGDLTRADLERAAYNRILPQIQSGNLDNPYRDLDESVKSVNEVTPKVAELAEATHLKSVVLMKNHEDTLPLKDTGKKVYIERLVGELGNPLYAASGSGGDSTDVTAITKELTSRGYTVVTDYNEADVVLLMIKPKGPQQSSNILGVIGLVEDVDSPTYDENAKPDGDDKPVTTVIDVKRIKVLADAVHANGGKFIATINISSPWILTNLEPYCDALLGTFSTSDAAVTKVLTGEYNPTGKLPVTMVADECVIELIETNIDGEIWEVCVSPNDVPGYEKEQYMLKTETGKAALEKSPSGHYAYKDTDGNLYWSGFGLHYDTRLPATENYIPAPYQVVTENELTQFLDPVFYENGEGEPTIGVTLLGVIKQDGKYFRDLNNNGVLDTFEDWRLDARTRADAMAASLTDYQLTHELVNTMTYSPKNTKTANVLDKNGKPVWTLVYNPTDRNDPNSTNIGYLSSGMRTFVIRSNTDIEVGVWFNNGLEQYAEWDAIQTGTVTVPYFTFTNPIAHGMPNSDGVAAAALGDGNADFVLTDAEYDRIVMWAKGIDGIYGPQIDLVTDPRWSRNSGTYGEREDMSAEIAKNLTIGYQNGDQGMVPGSILLTVKHFPGDGAAYNGFESHGQTGRYRIYSTENSLADYQLKPFIAAFEAGAAGVMPGYSQPIVDERIAPQSITYNGKTYDIKLEGRGNAFNPDVLQFLLRDILGFEGLINSDSLNVRSQQGVEDLSNYERMVLFLKAGCDCGVISFTGDNTSDLLEQALANGDITRADLERAASNRLLPQMQSGNMENPYRDLEESVNAFNEVTPKRAELAEETHLKSVVLMKNSENTLPLAKEAGKKVYVAGFNAKDNANVDGLVAALTAKGLTVVDDYKEADIAYLRVDPTIVGQGSSNLAVLDLGQDFETPVYDNNAKRTENTATITTVAGMETFKKIADAIHAKGGKVIGEINASSPWILSNMEPYCDALLGTYKTSDAAIAAVVAGEYNPTGKLAITMVADASVIALVETTFESGETWDVCVSPNDVPGYVKDQYMDKAVLDASPSGSYAYKDANGNLYISGFGLSYNK